MLLVGLTGCPTNSTTTISSQSNKSILTNDTVDFANTLHSIFEQSMVEYINNQQCLGIGVVNPKDFEFTLYIDTLNNSIIHIKDIESQRLIVPIIYKPSYLIFYLVVHKGNDNFYQVSLNDRMAGYVAKSEFNFFTWDELLLQKTLCLMINEGFQDKDTLSTKYQFTDDDNFEVKAIEGSWAYVKKLNSVDNNEVDFWTTWRNEKGLKAKPIFLQ